MLVKGGAVVDDMFVNVADGDALPAGPVIVSLKRYLAEHDALAARGTALGVRIEPAQSPESLGDLVHGLAVVVLVIPAFRDGRAFSWARLLRTRLGYKGEVRVAGHFLRDQLAFFVRVGVDAFDLSQNLSLEEIKKALTEISEVYQPSVDGRPTIRDLRVTRAKT
jgi:uncharacterized protein (DUF934 family)